MSFFHHSETSETQKETSDVKLNQPEKLEKTDSLDKTDNLDKAAVEKVKEILPKKEFMPRDYEGKVRIELPIWLGGGGIEFSGSVENHDSKKD